jgi:hypothetical protein
MTSNAKIYLAPQLATKQSRYYGVHPMAYVDTCQLRECPRAIREEVQNYLIKLTETDVSNGEGPFQAGKEKA